MEGIRPGQSWKNREGTLSPPHGTGKVLLSSPREKSKLTHNTLILWGFFLNVYIHGHPIRTGAPGRQVHGGASLTRELENGG